MRLDALDVEQAHVAGFAFGGTISHLVAIEHPQRILSLVPLATASGARVDSSGAPLTVLPASIRGLFGTPFPEGAEELDQHHKRLFAAMAGSSFDEVEYDDRRKESALRGAELARGDIQSVVGTTTGDRTDLLVQVDVPVLVDDGPRTQTRVPIVIADDPVATLGEHLAEAPWPKCQI